MNEYQKEQAETLSVVRNYLSSVRQENKKTLFSLISDYLDFRQKVDDYHFRYFSGVCNIKCYENRLSACCGKEGIITFFADMVINALVSTEKQMDCLEVAISKESEFKCIYLGNNGCIWKLKPIVCEMFLCDAAKKQVFEKYPDAKSAWDEFKQQEKTFKWPDRPVLFDYLEKIFLDAGYRSSLMYFHNSPGLLHVKRRAGIN